ncbi:MAG: M10 family metallopeptidase C-terminal domain-containing protein [Sphingomonas phyllosphaerae]|uniref:M10 family metallopeptidase C-terminal domain-containing protein n=1 Tax=Sphingomonas phyllosphaerae TaxID=257003 RepID=UPI002FFD12FB
MSSVTITDNLFSLGTAGDAAAVAGCGCAFCAAMAGSGSATPHVTTDTTIARSGAEMLTQHYSDKGFYYFSGDRNIDAVLIGSRWTATTLTFSFPSNGNVYGTNYDSGQNTLQLPFNDAQKAAARQAFDLVSGYTGLKFVEVAADAAERPTFRLSSTAAANVGSAMGYFPHTTENLGGDIWFGRTAQPYYETPQRGNWGFVTIMHEIGHTLGLKHGHSDYTDADLGSFFDLDGPFYGTRALEYDRDGQPWSIMSYTTSPNTSSVFNGDQQNQAQTYMMYDIAALQYLYGANYTTNAGDTVYRWDPKTGALSVNGVWRDAPAGNKVLETVWDGGGNDTYDFSNYSGNLSIDLRPGEFSTLSTAQIANALAYVDGDAPMIGNVGNALLYQDNTASLIENAIGGAGNDRIVGNQANNRLEGGAGDDLLVGGAGSDVLIGGAGNDVADFSDAKTAISITFNNNTADIIVANGGDRDVLRQVEGAIGTAFNDTLIGDRSDNFLSGGSGGSDYLNGGAGNDTLVGAGDTIVYTDRPDLIETTPWNNQWRGGAVSLDGSFDLVHANLVTQSTVLPHATVQATGPGGGADYYSFTAVAGSKLILDLDNVPPDWTGIELLDAQGNVLAGNYGVDRTDAGSRSGGAPWLEALIPTDGVFYVRVGGVYRNYLDDGSEVDEVGGFPRDLPYILNVSLENAAVEATVTAKGASRFYGGDGDDLIVAASGDDLVSGGAGVDTLSYTKARAGVTVDLTVTKAQNTGGSGIDTISGIENLTGSHFNDVLNGTAGNNVIAGGGGHDRLNGGAGRDTISFAGLDRGVTFSLAAQGSDQFLQPGSSVIATGFEDILGSAGNDTLTGNASANRINGGAGDDVLVDSASGLSTGTDTIDGGAGFDTISFKTHANGISALLTGRDSGTVISDDGALLATFTNIEAVEGGRGDDMLIGDEGNNTLGGREGADMLVGGGGADTLEGGFGDDIIDGGEGNDTAVFSAAVDHYVDLARFDEYDTGEGTDWLINIENLRGGAGNDSFFGNAGNNIFYDAGGDDLYVGRGGSDTVDYSNATRLLKVDLTIASQQDTVGGGFDTFDGVENIVGGNFGNMLFGTAGANRLVGGSDVDALVGGQGDDRLEGGDGDDMLIGDETGLITTALAASNNDTLIGGRGADRLIGGEGDDTLIGGSGNDILIGGSARVVQAGNNFRIEGLILMDGGFDTLDGGEGNDLGVLYYDGRKEAIRLDMHDTQARNVVYADGVEHGSVTSVETLRFYGGVGNDWVETGAGYDVLQGGAGNDHLAAGAGDDIVNGGAGDDWLDGGIGVDTISYAGATAGVTVDLRRTDAQDTGGAGIDTISNFENVTASAFSDTIYGDDGANMIRDGVGGDDRIYGMGGDDILGIARTYGQPAQTVLIDGGTGNDLIEYFSIPVYNRFMPPRFYRQTDTVTLIGGDGDDRINISGQKTGYVDAGAGDDIVAIGVGGLNPSTLEVTLGAGRDILSFLYVDNFVGEIDRVNIVHDFQTGAGGDKIDLTRILGGWYTGTNPFSIDQMKLVQDGDNVLLQVDMDRSGTYFQWRTMLTLEHTKVEDFTADNFYRVDGDGIFTPYVIVPFDPKGGAAAPSETMAGILPLSNAMPDLGTPTDDFAANGFAVGPEQAAPTSGSPLVDAWRDLPAPTPAAPAATTAGFDVDDLAVDPAFSHVNQWHRFGLDLHNQLHMA